MALHESAAPVHLELILFKRQSHSVSFLSALVKSKKFEAIFKYRNLQKVVFKIKFPVGSSFYEQSLLG